MIKVFRLHPPETAYGLHWQGIHILYQHLLASPYLDNDTKLRITDVMDRDFIQPSLAKARKHG
jgi:hypothetical protein